LPVYDLQVFDDPATGVYFESPDGTIPERDRKGELAFRPVSFTPWPVEAGTPGERLRIDVGPASGTSPRTFIFDRSPATGPCHICASTAGCACMHTQQECNRFVICVS